MADVLDCEPVPSSVRSARLFVVDKLQEWRFDDLVDGVALLTSELATNAVVHTGRPFQVGVERTGDRIRVEVVDEEPAPPTRFREEDDRGLFHGLNVVDSLATAWGSQPRRDGKVVWFELVSTGDSDHADNLASLRDLRSPDPAEGLPLDPSGNGRGYDEAQQEATEMATRHDLSDENERLREENEALRGERGDRVVSDEREVEVGRRHPFWKGVLVVLILVAAAVIAFFALGGTIDVDTQGDLEVPEVDVDVNAPDVNVDSDEAPPAEADASEG